VSPVLRRVLAAALLGAALAAPAAARAAGSPAGLAVARSVMRAYAGVPGVEIRGGGVIEGIRADVLLRYTLDRGRIAVAVTTQTIPHPVRLAGGGVLPAGSAVLITDYRRREILQRGLGSSCWMRAPLDPARFPPPRPLLPLDATYGAPRRRGRTILLRQTTADGAIDLVIDAGSRRVAAQRGVSGSYARSNARWRTLSTAPGRPSGRPACPG